MIDNNIIQSLGAGSGIDTTSLVTQLTEIERAAPQERIDSAVEKTEAQISDFGLIKSALATLQDAAQVLVDPEGLFSKSASFTESTAIVPTELDTDVLTGTYAFEVTTIAQSQSLSSTTFSATTDAVGEGTLTFKFGDWDAGVTTFTEDTTTTSKTVTIDSTNNTLAGLRDAINDGDFGVQASIVNDGTNLRLLITAESGENKQLEITVSESGGSPTNNDASDLSRFAFNASGSQLTQNQAGVDATLSVNGLSITRSSNKVDDVVDGLSLDLLKASPGEIVNVTVTDDKAFAEQNIRDFVDAYNTFLETIEPAVGFDEENEVRGSLANDALSKSILSQIRTDISSAIPGLTGTTFTTLTTIGIRTELDGTLSIDEDDFEDALDDNFEDLQKLLAPQTSSTASGITVNSYGAQTVTGSYAVSITTNPVKGTYAGSTFSGVTFPFDTTGKTYTFTATVNGTSSASITIPTATYATGNDLASTIQSLINDDTTLKANNASVVVTFDTDHLDFTSNKYGATSIVSFTAASSDLSTDLGISVANGTAGTDVAGSVNGEVGFGLGNVLLPKLGNDAEGLTLIVDESATSATVSFSRGFAGELDTLIDDFLSSTGLIVAREANLEQKLEDLDDDQELLDRRMTIFEERLMRQFIAMESILNGLNSSGSFLDDLINTLPFTNNDN